MSLEKREPKKPKESSPVSFRLSKDTVYKIEKLAEVLSYNKTQLIEDIVSQAFEETKKKYPKDFK